MTGGVPCTAYLGPNGAGHYVKMIHNGIEYIDMQLIGEAYWLMRNLLGMKAPELGKVFDTWNEGDLDSYLIQITADILQQPDPMHKGELPRRLHPRHRRPEGHRQVDRRQRAGHGHPRQRHRRGRLRPLPVARSRTSASRPASTSPAPKASRTAATRQELINAIRDALYCSKICAYAQGFQLMREAQKEYKWKLDFATIASIWRGGCIIRARFLQKITDAYTRNADLVNLLLDPYFNEQIKTGQANWRKVVALAATERHRRPGVHVAPWPTTTATARRACRPTCSRASATTSAPTPTSAPTSPAASSSTSTGPNPAARRLRSKAPAAGIEAGSAILVGAGLVVGQAPPYCALPRMPHTHGLRHGLHSSAAPRLESAAHCVAAPRPADCLPV